MTRRIRKMIIALSLFPCFTSTFAETWHDDTTGYTWTYFIVDGHAEIGAENGGYNWYRDIAVSPSPTGELVVPSILGGCPVTVLRDYALSNTSITSAVLPSTLTNIGNCVFSNCSQLKSVDIPDTLITIGREAFYYCRALDSFTIPENVIEWSSDCISGCSSLKDLKVLSWYPPTGYSHGYIGAYDLTNITVRICGDEFPLDVSGSYNGVTLTLLAGNGDTIPSNYMAMSRFYHGLNLVIGEGIVEICANAFRNSELSELHLPNSLRVIGDSALERAFSFPRYPYTATFPFRLNDGLESIGENAFGYMRYYMYGYQEVKIPIPNTVTNIGYNAFGGMTLDDIMLEPGNDHLQIQDGVLYYHENGQLIAALMASTRLNGSLVLDDSISKIQKGAFSGCKGITDIVIPSNITELPDYAFSQCSGVTNLVIHRRVLTISPSALRGIDISVVKVHIANPIYYVNGDILCKRLMSGDCEIVAVSSSTLDLMIPDEISSIGQEACVPGATKVSGGHGWYSVSYSSPTGILSVTDWNNVTSIGDWAFSFTSLSNLYLPEDVSHIGDYSFAWCRSLRNAEIRTPIGYRCFTNCTNLYSVTINVDVSEYAFEDNEILHEVFLEDGVQRIEAYGFDRCTNLFEIVIPSSVIYVDSSAFSGCNNLTNMIFEGHVPASFSKYTLPSNCKCVVPDALKDEWLAVITEDNISDFVKSKYDNADVITDEWISRYPELSSFGSKIDIGAAYTGKVDANGNRLQVWHDFVAGTDPTDPEDKFMAKIEIVDGIPHVTWVPELPAEEAALRSYRTYGKINLGDSNWTDVTNMSDSQRSAFRFFTVTVDMK